MKRMLGALSLLLLMGMTGQLHAQGGGFSPTEMARQALEQPFVGVTIDGKPERGLYQIQPTGASTETARNSARAFIGSLSEQQKKKTIFPVDSDQWRHWSNFHTFPGREGVILEELNEPQREAAYNLLRSSLSAKGYSTSRDIMRLNHHLAELVNNFGEFGEHKYWVTMFADPSSNEPWGWQFEGHHLIINYFLLGDQLVMTPTFMGSEPVRADSGKYAGVAVMQDVQDAGLALMLSLPEAQRLRAIIGDKEGRSSSLGELFKDNIVVPYEGLAAKEMNEESRRALVNLIALYVANMPDDHAKVRMDEVTRNLNETRFAWRGETNAEAVFYYRIHSSVIFIEFDHQGPIAISGSRSQPTRAHVHTVVRTPNGGDYGKALLCEHYKAHRNNPSHGHSHKPPPGCNP